MGSTAERGVGIVARCHDQMTDLTLPVVNSPQPEDYYSLENYLDRSVHSNFTVHPGAQALYRFAERKAYSLSKYM